MDRKSENATNQKQPSEFKPARSDQRGYSPEWILVHCLGFGLCWGWVHTAFFSGVLWGGAQENLVATAWLANVMANGLAMISFGALACRLSPLGSRRVFVFSVAALVIIGTAGLSLSAHFGDAAAFAGAIASGVGSAGLLLLWSEEYEYIAPDFAKKYTIPGSMAMGVAVFLLMNVLPFWMALVAMLLLPVVSVFLLSWSRREALKAGTDLAATEDVFPLASSYGVSAIKKALPLGFMFAVSVYCLAPGFMRGGTDVMQFVSSGIGGKMFAGVAMAMTAVAVMSIVVFKEKKIDLAYKLIVPFMAAGLLLLPFLDGGRSVLAGTAIMSGYILFEMFVWASLADRASTVKAPFAAVFGFGKASMNVGLMVGTFVGVYFASASSMLLVGVSVFIVYLFLVLESFVSPREGAGLSIEVPFNRKDAEGRVEKMRASEAAQMNLSVTFEELLSRKCQLISEEHGLSKRESEVLILLARGQSLQSAAETLGVAYSTVKTHTDRIYSKTKVHSRHELMDLVEKA